MDPKKEDEDHDGPGRFFARLAKMKGEGNDDDEGEENDGDEERDKSGD